MADQGEMRLQLTEKVATITICNPHRRNAISAKMWRQCVELATRITSEPNLRVVVLRGHGGDAFAAGADISEFSAQRQTPQDNQCYEHLIDRACTALAALPLPTVAMIQGYCIGGGMALAAACDLRMAETNATFAIPAARLGVGYTPLGVKAIMNLVGPAYAKEILFTGAHIDAWRAHQMGFVNRVVPSDELQPELAGLVETLCANAPLTIRAVKAAVDAWLEPVEKKDFSAVKALVEACYSSDDFKEGQQAFTQKRPPVFQGR